MSAKHSDLPNLKAKLAFAGRRFHAWWEGYAFDADAERAALQAMLPIAGGASGRPAPEIVAEFIWGKGRLSPGAPAFTMRYARLLELPTKADIVIFGADAGGPLNDIENGARWKADGFTHAQCAGRANLKTYGDALGRMNKQGADGALSFFQLNRDANPQAVAEFSAEFLAPGARMVFVDFTIVRKGARLPKCFPAGGDASPKTESSYRDALRAAGFVVEEAGDDTVTYLSMIADGWAGWRRAYAALRHIEDARLRATLMRALADHAALWAERFEALKSGQLRVLFLKTVKR